MFTLSANPASWRYTFPVLLLAVCGGAARADACGDPKAGALDVVDAYLATFNARDAEAHAQTLHYPSVRLDAAGGLVVYEHASEYAAQFAGSRDKLPWDHSLYDAKEIVHAHPLKAHVAVRFSRYAADGRKLSSHESLYIAVCREGRWGIAARSSFVPRVAK